MPQFLSPRTYSGAGHRVTSTDPTAGPAGATPASTQAPRRLRPIALQPRNGQAPLSSDGHVNFGAPTPNDAFPVESSYPTKWRLGVNDYP
jgi:hypothetical protein